MVGAHPSMPDMFDGSLAQTEIWGVQRKVWTQGAITEALWWWGQGRKRTYLYKQLAQKLWLVCLKVPTLLVFLWSCPGTTHFPHTPHLRILAWAKIPQPSSMSDMDGCTPTISKHALRSKYHLNSRNGIFNNIWRCVSVLSSSPHLKQMRYKSTRPPGKVVAAHEITILTIPSPPSLELRLQIPPTQR